MLTHHCYNLVVAQFREDKETFYYWLYGQQCKKTMGEERFSSGRLPLLAEKGYRLMRVDFDEQSMRVWGALVSHAVPCFTNKEKTQRIY